MNVHIQPYEHIFNFVRSLLFAFSLESVSLCTKNTSLLLITPPKHMQTLLVYQLWMLNHKLCSLII